MRRSALAVAMMLATAASAASGPFEDGMAAYNQGDYATASRLLRPLAEQGHTFAQFNLGRMYHLGHGVPQDDAEAVAWYRRAGEQGEVRAQVFLRMLSNKQSDAFAQYNRGVDYFKGRGVSQDDLEAARWFSLAAEQGHADAQNTLGNMYSNGQGVPQDNSQAHMWFSIAASRYSASEPFFRDMAVKNRDVAAAMMTPAEIAEAERLASEWSAQHQ